MIESIDQLTFAGLDRPALFIGAPLKPLGYTFLTIAISSMLLSLFYGITAFLALILIIPVYFVLRVLCEKDENALTVLRYSFKYYFLWRFNFYSFYKLSSVTVKANPIFSVPTFLPVEYGRGLHDVSK